MAGRVEGKVAFITGAARGQGRSHAVRLAEEGADIIAVDICRGFEDSTAPAATPEDLAETADMVKNLDRRIVTAEVDVRDYDALKAAVDSGVEQLGRLDIVVANAGIGTTGVKLHKMREDIWDETIDVNLGGVWKTVKAAVPHLLAGGRGGSVDHHQFGRRYQGLPAGRPLHRGQARRRRPDADLRGRIGPAFDPGQHRPSHPCGHPAADERDRPTGCSGPTWRTRGPTTSRPICQSFHFLPIPWVEPVDISNAVLFLASDEARYITGVTLPVDAGSLLK